MKVLNFIAQKKRRYEDIKADLNADIKTASKLGFMAELNKIEKERSNVNEIMSLLEEIASETQKEKYFSETEISHLQSAVHEITGDGDVMQLFNSLLGIGSGA